MKVSIYHLVGDNRPRPGERVTFYQGVADWEELIQGELDQSKTRKRTRDRASKTVRSQLSQSAFVQQPQRTLVLGMKPSLRVVFQLASADIDPW